MEEEAGGVVLALAFSDVHSPRYLHLLSAKGNFDLVLMAGDLVEKSNVDYLKPVVDFASSVGRNVVAVFGNEEHREAEEEFIKRYPQVRWLNDDYAVIDTKLGCVAVVGSRGSLLKPTSWQRKHLPGIEEEYKKKPEVVRELVREAKRECPTVIYLSHYAPTWRTLIGERRSIWPYLGDPRLERVLVEEGVRIAVHGHAHHGRVAYVNLGGTVFYNVALPARGRPVKLALSVQRKLI